MQTDAVRVQREMLRELGGSGRSSEFAEEREQARSGGLGECVLRADVQW